MGLGISTSHEPQHIKNAVRQFLLGHLGAGRIIRYSEMKEGGLSDAYRATGSETLITLDEVVLQLQDEGFLQVIEADCLPECRDGESNYQIEPLPL